MAYTPSADFNGIDTLTYIVNNRHVDSAAATVTVDVRYTKGLAGHLGPGGA